MSEAWYVRAEGQGETGPFTEKEIWSALVSGEISDAMQIRQGNSEWCSSTRVKQIFEQLQQQGWFVNDNGDACGPFTEARLRELFEQGNISPDAKVRRGSTGNWQSILGVLNSRQLSSIQTTLAADDGGISAQRKWSTTPIQHEIVPLIHVLPEANNCLYRERLLLRESSGSDVFVTRTNGSTIGRLAKPHSRAVLLHSERGCLHVALLHSHEHHPATRQLQVSVAIVTCPPGASAEDSVRYIERFWPRMQDS